MGKQEKWSQLDDRAGAVAAGGRAGIDPVIGRASPCGTRWPGWELCLHQIPMASPVVLQKKPRFWRNLVLNTDQRN